MISKVTRKAANVLIYAAIVFGFIALNVSYQFNEELTADEIEIARQYRESNATPTR